MIIQDRFVSTSELQKNVSKTIDKARHDDVIIIRNNKLEAAIISIDKYNQFLEYMEWKKICDVLDNLTVEKVPNDEAEDVIQLIKKSREELRFTADDIEKIAESGADYDVL